MNKNSMNIYKLARKEAGLTQEEAAEKLHVGVRTLAEYESGRVRPNDDIVEMMTRIYGTPWLPYMHFKNSVLGKYLPELQLIDAPMAVLKLQKEMNDVKNVNDEAIEAVCDGVIDSEEQSIWQRYKKEILEMASACLTIWYGKEGA